MKTRKLGNNGFEVSEVGLGCWQLGADWGPSMAKDTAWAILEEAVENGITFLDTADVYGAGQSESFIGEFLKSCEKPIRVATKFGRDGEVYPDKYSEAALRKSVNDSIKRLGVEPLDLLQLHCIPTEVMREGEVFDWLRKIQKEGLIKHFGASVETVGEGLLCIEQEGLLSLQVIFNIFRQKVGRELLPKAKESGTGIIVRLPLASGLLAGKFTKNTTFSEKDHRNFNRNGELFNVGETFAGLPFEKGVELTQTIEKEFLPKNMSMVQLALRGLLDHEAVSCIIPGASSPRQVKTNAEASSLSPLSEETHQVLSDFYTKEVHQNIRGAY